MYKVQFQAQLSQRTKSIAHNREITYKNNYSSKRRPLEEIVNLKYFIWLMISKNLGGLDRDNNNPSRNSVRSLSIKI